jgi:hypothetical protein
VDAWVRKCVRTGISLKTGCKEKKTGTAAGNVTWNPLKKSGVANPEV